MSAPSPAKKNPHTLLHVTRYGIGGSISGFCAASSTTPSQINTSAPKIGPSGSRPQRLRSSLIIASCRVLARCFVSLHSAPFVVQVVLDPHPQQHTAHNVVHQFIYGLRAWIKGW